MNYELKITLGHKSTGTIVFDNECYICYYDPTNVIADGVYTKCSLTKMASKKRDGIYIPDEQTGKIGIFLHFGRDASWSEGCIVTPEADLIFDKIGQRNAENITIILKRNNNKLNNAIESAKIAAQRLIQAIEEVNGVK